MAETLIPEGWSLDEGDPSVGIFGETYVHESCTEDYDKGCEHVVLYTETTSPEYEVAHHVVQCIDCWSWTTFREVVFVGFPEE